MVMESRAVSAPSSHRGLLALVILLGAAILLGVGALIAGAFLKLGGGPRGAARSEPYVQNLAAPGAHIESANLDGNRLLIRLSGPDGEELVVLDAASGRVVGRVRVAARP
jgi:hypothetical protein